MKVTSITERQFITSIISKSKRLDGRNLADGRTLEIKFLKEWGGCIVYLGNTVILSQVSAEITEPKASSPTEGALHVNFEVSPMSAPDVNLSRSSNEFVELQRSLERCIRDSKCIDLESLCIVAGVKVWTIRVDIHAMNDDGNVLECSSIAAISALAHFKRPDVTVVGIEVTVHSLDDHEPLSLNLHHMPIAINMALFGQGTYIVMDPTEVEERISDGWYIVGMNAHQEVCFIHRNGSLLLPEDTIQKCIKLAVGRAQTVTQTIRAARNMYVKGGGSLL
ncbi:Exosome complex component RRP45 [Araneus ventricosus]|uniref:Exosome complex component RRP45 n=1 Tax=Araneus ventricosus TaxID=182803 RepID=A0A4Y2FB72_ARAVE|nr:Exosome complex component RRP45 [Araneus ventricosus]